jgi:2-phospho-L-lactate guanylyltransferase
MAALAQAERAVVIAPDRHERGTNALLIKPAQLINFAFGEDSAQRHAALAKASGVQPLWYRSPSIGLDVDEALDLRMYEAAPFVLD